jgi:hypothetical protein
MGEVIKFPARRRDDWREDWERQRQQQIARGRERLRQLFGDEDGPVPPRAA